MPWYDFFYKQKEEQDKEKIRKPGLSIAATGTEIYNGYLDVEYYSKLREPRSRYEEFHRMRSDSGIIQMCISSITWPILSSEWSFKIKEDYADFPEAETQLQFVKQALTQEKIRNLIKIFSTAPIFGFSLCEKIYLPMEFNGMTYMAPRFKFISQRTVERWPIDDENNWLGIVQHAYGDDARYHETNFVSSATLVHYAINQEGDNYEGRSMLRPAYNNWIRKNENFKQIAVGNYFLSIPFLKVYQEQNAGILNDDDLKQLNKAISQRLNRRKQLAHVIFPEGYKAEEEKSTFDPMKLYECNSKEDDEIVKSFLCNFLLLTKGSGSFALSNDLSDFFLKGLEQMAVDMQMVIDDQIIKPLIEVNFGEKPLIQTTHSEVGGKGGVKIAEAISKLLSAGAITGDDKLEDWIRKLYKMPESDLETRRERPSEVPEPEPDPEPGGELQLSRLSLKSQAAKSKKRINKGQEELAETYEKMLGEIVDAKIKKLSAILKRNTGKQSIFKIRAEDLQVSYTSLRKYAVDLLFDLYTQERDDLVQSFSLAKKKNLSTAKAMLFSMVDSDIKDALGKIDNATIYTLIDSLDAYDDPLKVIPAIFDTATTVVKGAKKKTSVVVSKAINSSRQQIFEENYNDIESYTFYNPSPKADICVYLSGRTIKVNDPMVESYSPPLHYNCSTVLLPNLRRWKNNPKTEVMRPTKKDLDSINVGVLGDL